MPRNYEMYLHMLRNGNGFNAKVESNKLATFSCKHNITKRPICATPCNGVSDMCEDEKDEMCQGAKIEIVLSSTLVFSVVFITISYLVDNFIGENRNNTQEVIEMDQIGGIKRVDLNIIKKRISKYHCGLDFRSAIQLADKYYNERKNGLENVDEYLMAVLGTNGLTDFFYDCVDRSIMIKIGLGLQRKMPWLINTISQLHLQNIWAVIICIVSMSVRYSDLPKDILFLYIIWLRLGNYDFLSFPTAIFYSLLSSMIAAEILHSFTIIMYHYKGIKKSAILILIIPLLPAYYLYQYLKFKLRLHKLITCNDTNCCVTFEEINKYEIKCEQLQLLMAKMQCTENVLENLTQVTILIMIISLSHTTTRGVENIEAAFVEENALLGYALAVLSFTSVIRGQLTFLKANKNGCLSLTGTLIVVPYFIIGTFTRYDFFI